jgi:hypothetical protein
MLECPDQTSLEWVDRDVLREVIADDALIINTGMSAVVHRALLRYLKQRGVL